MAGGRFRRRGTAVNVRYFFGHCKLLFGFWQVDYEQRIKQLEDDMRHEQSMRKIMGERLDAHDISFGAVKQIIVETERIVQKTAENLEKLTALLLRTHSNGNPKD